MCVFWGGLWLLTKGQFPYMDMQYYFKNNYFISYKEMLTTYLS